MKQKILLILSLAVLWSSCGKNGKQPGRQNGKVTICVPGDPYAYLNQYSAGSLCTTDTCLKYQAIWKALFMAQNHLADTFFDKHITLMQSGISHWEEGISYHICYQIHSDWAIAYACDQFIINISDSAQGNLPADLPRNENLNREQVKTILDKKALSSSLQPLSGQAAIRFPSMQNALENLTWSSDVNTLCMSRIYINPEGHLAMEASAQYADKENTCIVASLDLVTGTATSTDSPCRVY